MLLLDDLQLTAPAPNSVRTATAQTVGRPGTRNYNYWLVSHYPIGESVSEPFFVRNAPSSLSATNYVLLSWGGFPAEGVTAYDVLRTDTNQFPRAAGLYALAVGLPATTTEFRDSGQALTNYDPAALHYGAPVACHVHLNNRDYARPTLELPCQVQVSSILFADGSSQDTATTGGGQLIGGPGITIVPNPGPPATITITAVPAGTTGQVQFNNAGVFGASANFFWDSSYDELNVPSMWIFKKSNPDQGLWIHNEIIGSPGTSILTMDWGPAYTRLPLEIAGSYMLLNYRDISNALIGTGRVGISLLAGTTPQWILDVQGDINIIDTAPATNGYTFRVNGVPFGVPAGTTGQVQFNNAGAFGASANLFWDNANSRLGIGTQTPLVALEVTGDVRVTSATAYRLNLQVVRNDFAEATFGWGSAIQALAVADGIGYWELASGINSTPRAAWLQCRGDPVTAYPLLLNPVGGNVGINTLNPQAALDVNGVIQSTGFANLPTSGKALAMWYDPTWEGAAIRCGDWADNYFGPELTLTIQANPLQLNCYGQSRGNVGNVFIGQSGTVGTPFLPFAAGAGAVQVTVGNRRNSKVFLNLVGEQVGAITFSGGPAGDSGGDYRMAAIDSGLETGLLTGNLSFHTRALAGLTERMRIDSQGRVGIGTVTPAHTLDVNGDIRCTGNLIADNLPTSDPGAGSKRFWADPSDGHRVKFAN